MPLLKRKTFPLLQPPTYDPNGKDRRVWVSPITSEIYEDYETYVKRYNLYRQRLWQCEVSGRSGLTYKEALESERTETDRVKEKLPDELQKRVLQRAQFQIGRLDKVVNDVYDYYVDRFDSGDLVTCRWTDGVKYSARVLRAVSDNAHSSSNGSKTNGKKLMNGTTVSNGKEPTQFLVELVDDDFSGLDDYQGVIDKENLKRDRFDFTKNLLKKFLRENLKKDSYNGAPWVVKESTANKFEIDTKLPKHLQEIKDKVDAKSRRKKLVDASPATTLTDNSKTKSSKSTVSATQQHQHNQELQSKNRSKPEVVQKKPVVIDAKKIEASIKYPIEDLDIPSYRRQPSGTGPIIDMKPGQAGATKEILNPTGDMPLCPTPSQQQTVPSDTLGSLLMVWSFLSVFAKPLGLFPFPLDDFESALRHTNIDFKSDLLIESNVCLLNAIIKERQQQKAKKSSSSTLSAVNPQHLSVPSSLRGTPTRSPSRQPSVMSEDEQDVSSVSDSDNQHQEVTSSAWINPHVAEIGQSWDDELIAVENDREGWEDVLIGCINHITTPDRVSQVDRIFNLLVPDEETTLEEREEAYLRLSLTDKVYMLGMLVGVVNECAFIKEFMEECQEQMTELRKQKIDLSRERKRIHAERQELERRIKEDEKENPSDSDDSESEGETGDEENIDRTSSQQETSASSSSRSESRQALLKRKQIEREEREAKRMKLYHQQREEARARSQILKARSTARRKLDEEERHLHKKEEQIEHSMRRYTTARIKPLGRDKFYSRYLYLDNIGGGATHGTGRLFVQSPSDVDFTLLRERNDPTTYAEIKPSTTSTNTINTTTHSANGTSASNNLHSCGHGGGVQFVSTLMKAQGFEKEAEFMKKRIEVMEGMEDNEAATTLQPEEWWRCYDEPEDIENLLAWLNPKGEREHKLKKELTKHSHDLALGMKKRITEHNNASKPEVTRRSTRKNTSNGPLSSWQAYVNKYAK